MAKKIYQRLSLEKKFDVNPAYCDSFLKQTLWAFMTGYIIAEKCSMINAARAYMDYFGIEDDEFSLTTTYRTLNEKIKTLARNEEHLKLVDEILKKNEHEAKNIG